MTPKVSCVLCTYGRHATVERSVGMFLGQDYAGPSELVIFSTSPVPLVLSADLEKRPNVILQNSPTRKNGQPWQSLGEIRNAALGYASGFLFVCWDDDDLFLPWHLSESVSRWAKSGKRAWKPRESLFSTDAGQTFKLAGNAMEASILAELEFVKEHGFSEEQSGAEHVQGGWLDVARGQDELAIEDAPPTYGYVWGDGLHKTSGNIDAPDNFESHKAASNDFGDGKPLSPWTPHQLRDRFAAAYDFGKG